MSKAKKYCKKPIVIEAIKWDGTYKSYLEIKHIFRDLEDAGINFNPGRNKVYLWKIRTLEGSCKVSEGDYVIKGTKGEFYPVKQDIFNATYEEVFNEEEVQNEHCC